MGCPETLLTDNGKEFENALFRELCRGLDILKSRTTVYQSRSNGCVERWQRSLNSMLGKVVQTHQTDWPSHVPFVANAYNTTIHSSTVTPLFSHVWSRAAGPLDIVLGTPGGSGHTVSEYAQILLDNMLIDPCSGEGETAEV